MIRMVYLVLVLSFISSASSDSNETLPETPLKRCAQVSRVTRPRFHLVRRCSRSDSRILATANFSSVWRCTDFAIFKSALAFNFGWRQGSFGHCEVLECPEHDTLSTLRRRENYDYYSLYANPMPSKDWHCLPKVGIFRIGHGEARSESQRKCQDWAVMPSPRNKTEDKEDESPTGGNEKAEDENKNIPSSPPATDSATQNHRTSRSAQTEVPGQLFHRVNPNPKFIPPDDDFFLPPEFIPEEWFWNTEQKEAESLSSNATSNSTSLKLAGRLADVLSADRTTNLTKFLLSKEGKFFSPVLVGLASILSDHHVFATPFGEPVPCFRFRAWAPGHPLPSRRFQALLLSQTSTPKPKLATNVTVNGTVTPKENQPKSTVNSTAPTVKTQPMLTNETINSTAIAVARRLAEKRRDQMTLCVYLRRDALWQTQLCSTKTSFLCELLPSGGPCKDANSSDERAACEYENIGVAEDRCSAWKDEMITTTAIPIEPDKGQDGGVSDGDNSDGDEESNTDEGNSTDDVDDDDDEQNDYDDDEQNDYDNEDNGDDNPNSYENNMGDTIRDDDSS